MKVGNDLSKDVERVKVRLNRITLLSLREYKRLKYGDEEIPLSDSYVVSDAYKLILDKIENIDWKKVNEADIPNISDNQDFPATSLPTTLSLDDEVLLGLRGIQNGLIEKTGGRVFFSYVIKIVLLASILEISDRLNNYKKIE